MKKYTHDEIIKMDYSRFVALINERNRPSGGIRTVHNVAVNAFVNEKKRVLEIGSNTGFTSVNIALLTGCEVVGIDINEESVEKARIYAELMGVKDKVTFIHGTATSLPFKDQVFDLVWASNVTSFISDKESAIAEYMRVLKPGGTLAAVPIYYRMKVPTLVIDNVSAAIGTEIKEWNKGYWKELFSQLKTTTAYLDIYYEKDFFYEDRKSYIESYVNEVIETNIQDEFLKGNKPLLKERFRHFMELFNENLKYAGFSIFLFQKKIMKDEVELFVSHEIA